MNKKYSDSELVGIHNILLEILNEINRICEKYSIPYFTVGGTTIGAVRHKGFIPWDDDIDIGMLRDDYEKFLSVCKTELKNNFFVLNFETNKNYYAYFTKICKKGTLFVEKETRHLKYDHCIFIDVFPFDNLPNDEKLKRKYFKKVNAAYQLFKSKSLWEVSDLSSKKAKILGLFVRPLLHIFLLFIPKKHLYNKLDAALKKYNNTNCFAIATIGSKRSYYSKDGATNLIKMPFENTFVYVSSNYDEPLRRQFGNYMTLPPEEKRISHHPLKLKI